MLSGSAHPYFPPVEAGKQGLLDVYRSVKNDRLRLATHEFYEASFVRKNVVLMRMLWPLAAPGVRHILRDNAANYDRPYFARSTIAAIEGEGLLSAVGERALRLRRIIAGAFGQRYQLSGFDAFLDNNARLIEEIGMHGRLGSFDLHPFLSAWASKLNIELIYSEDSAPHIGTILNLVHTRAEQFSKDAAFLLRLPKNFPTPTRRKLWNARAVYLEIAKDLLEKRRRRPSDRGDVLDRLIGASDEETGESLSDAEIVDLTITFMSAGIETTASGVTAVLYLLAVFPDVQERVREEALRVFGKGRPGPEDFNKLVYIQAVVDEGLRYYPPVPLTARQALGDDETPFGPVRKGDLLVVFIWCVHHNSRNWDSPRSFRPERFLPENHAAVPTFGYLPFGRGPRQCIGSQIARRATTLAVAEVIANFEIALERDWPMEVRGGYSLLFPHGLHVTARPLAT